MNGGHLTLGIVPILVICQWSTVFQKKAKWAQNVDLRPHSIAAFDWRRKQTLNY
jgi:hypothetical protein